MTSDTANSLHDLVNEFVEGPGTIKSALIYQLSDISDTDFAYIRGSWHEIPVDKRQRLMIRVVETSEVNFEVDFHRLASIALLDEDPFIRVKAIESLWEDDSPFWMRSLVELLQQDDDSDVRAAAAQSLGRFVLAGELGKLDRKHSVLAEEALLEICMHADETPDVIRRSLESIAYSERDEISSLIEEAYSYSDIKMRASAIFAMGRSADPEWETQVLESLEDIEPEIRFEAARAAGELTLQSAANRLILLLNDNDREVKETAIWALGEIGGDDAQQALAELSESTDDDELLDAIEDALNMALLNSGEFSTLVFTRESEQDEVEIDEPDDLIEDLEDDIS